MLGLRTFLAVAGVVQPGTFRRLGAVSVCPMRLLATSVWSWSRRSWTHRFRRVLGNDCWLVWLSRSFGQWVVFRMTRIDVEPQVLVHLKMRIRSIGSFYLFMGGHALFVDRPRCLSTVRDPPSETTATAGGQTSGTPLLGPGSRMNGVTRAWQDAWWHRGGLTPRQSVSTAKASMWGRVIGVLDHK